MIRQLFLSWLALLFVTSRCLYSSNAFTRRLGAQRQTSSRHDAVKSSKARQILEFQEPQTNVTVVLVGAMHYNPSSIHLAQTTIRNLAVADQLGSVIVESCDIRWNKTLALYEERPWLKALLQNEMLTSCELAQKYNRPVILGDQRINITSAALKASLQETVVDLTSPFNGGWKRFASDVANAWEETVPFGGEGYLSAFAFLDPRLLVVLPVSLVKYPLSFLVRDPRPTSIVLLGLLALNYLDDSSSAVDAAVLTNQVPLFDWLVSFGLSALETTVFARLLLKPLLAERNEILAQSILDQCRLLATTTQEPKPTSWFEKAMQQTLAISSNKQPRSSREATITGEHEIIYAPGSHATIPAGAGNNDDQAVVAILGMAHCNGIKKLLQEQLL
eukprot:scaffold1391_cov123-Cylindrotheca_fusiformis.AAC.6